MPWFGFHLHLQPGLAADALEAELVSELLLELGAEGFEVRDEADPVELVASFSVEDPARVERLRLEIRARLEQASLPARLDSVTPFEEVDWSTHWRHHFSPLGFGPLWIVPSWLEPPAEAEVVLQIDPSSAFGTGLHPTTALCLEWVIDARPDRLLDVGTGTGVLALAAVLLGEGTAVGVDNDPEAVRVAIENRERNGVAAARLDLSETPVEALAEVFPAVVANVLKGPLVDLAPAIAARVAPGGELVLSGLLVEQVDEVAAAYEKEGLRRGRVETRGEWARASLHRPGS